MKPWIDRLNRLSTVERRTLAIGALATAVLLAALARTCQESVERGERLRAEQRAAAAAGLLR